MAAVTKAARNWQNLLPDHHHIQDHHLIIDRMVVHSKEEEEEEEERMSILLLPSLDSLPLTTSLLRNFKGYNILHKAVLSANPTDYYDRVMIIIFFFRKVVMITYDGGADSKLAFLKPGDKYWTPPVTLLPNNNLENSRELLDYFQDVICFQALKFCQGIDYCRGTQQYGGLVKYYLQEINRPVTRTRSFCAQLHANAENNNKVAGVAVVKKGVTKPAQKKVVAYGRLTDKQPKEEDLVVDIDAADLDNELAAVEYVEDLYRYYKVAESSSRVDDYMDKQHRITINTRDFVVDWLIEVHDVYKLMPETLYLTIYIMDRFLSINMKIKKRELMLVGAAAILIASKYEEDFEAPYVEDLINATYHRYTPSQVVAMEKMILGELEWTLTLPTPYVFLVRFIKASAASSSGVLSDQTDDDKMENMVFYLAELGLMHYHPIIMYSPSMLAASAVYAARCTLTKTPLWTETLKFHTGYSEPQIMDCAKLLVGFHIEDGLEETKLKILYKKYSKSERCSVALLSPARNLLLE